MAELPELWTESTPEVRRSQLERSRTSGLEREAETFVPAPPDEPPAQKPRRERGPFVTYLQMPWSYGDQRRSDLWHRMQCRWGRHKMTGGHSMQLDGAIVFIERHCRWCEADAG